LRNYFSYNHDNYHADFCGTVLAVTEKMYPY
jgi:hypothetical protein